MHQLIWQDKSDYERNIVLFLNMANGKAPTFWMLSVDHLRPGLNAGIVYYMEVLHVLDDIPG